MVSVLGELKLDHASDFTTIFLPSGATSRKSVSPKYVCVNPVSVRVTPTTGAVTPDTVIGDG